ncbi:MAG: hypothetical protein P8Y45_14820 [Exilibacterium sp.]
MSSSLFEIVELSNGDIALRHAGEEGEPVVSIRFSQESLYFLRDAKFEIAKAMIEAGLEAAGDMAEQDSSLLEMDLDDTDIQTLH